MKTVNGTISSCCETSVSGITGSTKTPYKHYKCNNCGNITEPIIKPMWVITDKGKYKPI